MNQNLSGEQFSDLDELDDGESLYHGSPPHTRDSIAKRGLHPAPGLSDEGMLGHGVTHAVFLTSDPHHAAKYGSDLYRVDASGLRQEVVDGPNMTYHHAVLEHIPPHRITKVR